MVAHLHVRLAGPSTCVSQRILCKYPTSAIKSFNIAATSVREAI
jgi:hypothetical protein